MALHKLVSSNYGRKLPVSIKYDNLHSFKEGVILLCHSILETRRISHLPGSAQFTIPLLLSSLDIKTAISMLQISKTLDYPVVDLVCYFKT